MSDNFSLVSSKYNKTEGRQDKTEIKELRNFNNWIKSSLILLCPNNGNVLDICGGRGGDLYKYRFKHVNNYVLFDNADISIKEAENRYNKMDISIRPKNIIFKHVDCFTEDTNQLIPDNLYFDFASCQFAFHYACGNLKHIERLFKNVSERLKKDCLFVGTTVNEHKLIEKLKNSKDFKFGNSKYSIEFDKKEDQNLSRIGTKYYFNLIESVPNVPEYLVHFNTIKKIAEKYNLKLICKKTFEECKKSKFSFISDLDINIPKYRKEKYINVIEKSFERVKDIDNKNKSAVDQWEICDLYLIFIFKKT